MKQKILLASTVNEKQALLKTNLQENEFNVIDCPPEFETVLQSILMLKPEVLVFYETEPDEPLLDKIRQIQDNSPIAIVIFADRCKEELISESILAGASSLIVDSIETHRLRPIIEAALARFNKCQSLRTKLTETERKLEERRDIDRAKGILMSNKNMSEDEAYQLLRKMAMEKNLRIGALAKTLIAASDLLK